MNLDFARIFAAAGVVGHRLPQAAFAQARANALSPVGMGRHACVVQRVGSPLT